MLSSIHKQRSVVRQTFRFFYDARSKNDTIFAPTTSINQTKGSPQAVIRVSGTRTKYILNQITRCEVLEDPSHGHSIPPRTIPPRYAKLAKMFTPMSQELIDTGIVLWFPKPHSFTGEDVCEFHLHGSEATVSKMMSVLGSMEHLRPAEGGEFSRRALENGKMSLIQVESLPDLIKSRTENQRKLALKGLSGHILNKYNLWLEDLKSILAHFEATIDFGEDEVLGEHSVLRNCRHKLNRLSSEVSDFLHINSHTRNLINNGFRVAILGPPNAGKSTFMNLLSQQQKSIVSELAGTTRDVVEHSFEFGGHLVTLCDTAGLRDLDTAENIFPTTVIEQHQLVEREGMKRAFEEAKRADLIIYLIDGSRIEQCDVESSKIKEELSKTLQLVVEDPPKRKIIYIVVNKIDLNNTLLATEDQLKSYLPQFQSEGCLLKTGFISCKTQENYQSFVTELTRSMDNLTSQGIDENENVKLEYVNERHLSLLNSMQNHLMQACDMNDTQIDEIAQHVRESLDYLSRVVGLVDNEEIFDIVFRDFCIGK